MLTGPKALKFSVGRSGRNDPGDVMKVLDWLRKIPATQGGADLAMPSPEILGQAIEKFQRTQFPGAGPKQYDGRIDPNFGTHKKLIELSGAGVPVTGAPPPAPTPASTFTEGFYQGNLPWQQMRLNNGSDKIIAKGCLLSCMASGFNWRGVRVPAGMQAATKAVIDAQTRGDSSKGHTPIPALSQLNVTGPLNPGIFNAWMTAASVGGKNGFNGPNSSDLNAGHVGMILNAAGYPGLQFIGQFSYAPSQSWLMMPPMEKIGKWINDGRVVIAHLDPTMTSHHNHWVLLTEFLTGGMGTAFKVWDVGYGPSNENHTSVLWEGSFDVINHFGPVNGWK